MNDKFVEEQEELDKEDDAFNEHIMEQDHKEMTESLKALILQQIEEAFEAGVHTAHKALIEFFTKLDNGNNAIPVSDLIRMITEVNEMDEDEVKKHAH